MILRYDQLVFMFAVAVICSKLCAAADSCPEFPPIQHADTIVSDGPPYKKGTTVEINCDEGFKGYGTPRVTCLEDGRWSNHFPRCRALRCRRDISQIDKGRRCRKPCIKNEDCRGEFKRCECDGWCGLSCFNPDANCPDLKAPENGFILGKKFSYGYKVSYGCNDGFILNGQATRKCRSDRTWSRYEPKCLPFGVCGISGANEKSGIKGNVIEGNDASEEAWPWQALLFYEGNHNVAQIYNPDSSFGGGSVINNRWILTAAHVFDQFIRNTRNIVWKKKFLIAIGMTSYPKPDHVIPNHVHIFEPLQMYRHEAYKAKTFDYDVALIQIGNRLKRNGKIFIADSQAPNQVMEFSRHIRPVCLPCMKSDPTRGNSDILKDFNIEQCSQRGRSSVHNLTTGGKVVVTGFGYEIDSGFNFQGKPTVLQEGLVEIQDDNTCVDGVRRMPDDSARYTDRMICAESANKSLKTDACKGDSGGPLVKQFMTSERLTYWMQVGIVSWGYGCKSDYPGYYTLVSSIMSWIIDTIKSSKGPCTTKPCKNDGICKQNKDEPFYSCTCVEPFTGKNCEKFEERLKQSTNNKTGAIILQCLVPSEVQSKIVWWLNRDSIDPADRWLVLEDNGRKLVIPSPHYEHSGVFSCQFTYDGSERMAKTTVIVKVNPKIACGQSAGMDTSARREAPRILGGTKTRIGFAPFVALLYKTTDSSYTSKGAFCGGSLVDTRHVLTAAHCFHRVKYKEAVVYLGKLTTDANRLEKLQQSSEITRIIIHPEHHPTTLHANIVVIVLKTEIYFTTGVKPICIPTPKDDNEEVKPRPWKNGNTKYGIVYGWGITENGLPSNSLLEVILPIVKQGNCKKAFEPGSITDTMFCAGGESKRDACAGDSGGPFTLWSNKETRWYLGGIVSWGDQCGIFSKPGVYERIDLKMRKWIYDNTDLVED